MAKNEIESRQCILAYFVSRFCLSLRWSSRTRCRSTQHNMPCAVEPCLLVQNKTYPPDTFLRLTSCPCPRKASVNLSTSQARVLTAVDTSRGESSTSVQSERKDIINAAVSVGFPATVLWQETIGGDTTVVLDIQGLKVSSTIGSSRALRLEKRV